MWRNSSNNINESDSIILSDSEDNITSTSTEQNILIDSSDNDESFTKKTNSTNFFSSSIIENKERKKLNKLRIIYSDEESISDIDENLSDQETKSEIDDSSNDDLSSNSKDTEDNRRKDITHDYSKNNLKELKLEKSCNSIKDDIVEIINTDESENLENELVNKKEKLMKEKEIDTDNDIQDNELSVDNFSRPEDKDLSIVNLTHCDIDSDSDLDYIEECKNSEKNAVSVSCAKQEMGVSNIDPLIAQKRATLTCKLQQLENQLNNTKLLLNTVNIDILPDKGLKLKESIIMQEKEIEEVEKKLKKIPSLQSIEQMNEHIVSNKEEENNEIKYQQSESEDFHTTPEDIKKSKKLGKKAQETMNLQYILTQDRIEDLHRSLLARPSEDAKADDPPGLKVKLMPHQQHALAWIMWREKQRPPGGVLADDMGLGKTLTMISLIMATLGQDDRSSDDSDDEWHSSHKSKAYKGGTLVVCPASLLSQWENEVNTKCKKGLMSVEVYHGNNREKRPQRLAKKDIVITTYNIISREYKTTSTVYKINWKRVILDEAHIIRNHKSQASQAVCDLITNKRWTLTGTPIQNKEMDLYSIFKFLKCSPFDDIRVWKRWVENKSSSGHQRLATIMKSLMLRRTKEELQEQGALESLPNKRIEEIEVTLDPEEKLIYEKVLMYSRTLFAQFLSQRAEKDHMVELESGLYDKPTFLSNPNKNTQFAKAQNKLLSLHADVKTHEILVLLLRLRQICCHPSLIHAMLDQNDFEQSGIMDEESVDSDIVSRINNMSLYDDVNKDINDEEIGIDQRVTKNILASKNPVFQLDRVSSKMKVIFNMVEEIIEKGDKLIIVSQWSSMFEIIESNLSTIRGATFEEFSGRVPIKNRQSIIESFNDPFGDPKILLLSLTAGGVGLNLVGGNHLLLIDIHWNPQLESQAQDRIYRFGQKKDVFIYKFICKDTIEERIKHLQARKLAISQTVLSGAKNKINSKLSLNDLKSLFGF